MEITYTNTHEDVKALAKSFPFWKRVWWRFRVPLFVLICGAPGTIVLAVFQLWYGLLWAWGLTGALLLWAGLQWMLSGARHKQAMDAKWLERRTVRLKPDALEGDGDNGWSRRNWSAIDRIRITSKHVFIFINKVTAFAIPKRAFPSAAEADQFERELERYYGQAKSGQSPPFTATLNVEAIEQDEIGVLQVQYQNTADDYATVQYEGPQQAQPPKSTYGVIVVWTTILALGFVVIMIGGNYEDNIAGEILMGTLGFVILLTVTGMMLMHFARRKAATHVDKCALRLQTVVIAPKGVTSFDPVSEGFSKWNSIEAVEANDRFIVIFTVKPHIGYLIPKSAFADSLAAERFQNSATTFLQEAHATANTRPAEVVETGNPYQSPMTQ